MRPFCRLPLLQHRDARHARQHADAFVSGAARDGCTLSNRLAQRCSSYGCNRREEKSLLSCVYGGLAFSSRGCCLVSAYGACCRRGWPHGIAAETFAAAWRIMRLESGGSIGVADQQCGNGVAK